MNESQSGGLTKNARQRHMPQRRRAQRDSAPGANRLSPLQARAPMLLGAVAVPVRLPICLYIPSWYDTSVLLGPAMQCYHIDQPFHFYVIINHRARCQYPIRRCRSRRCIIVSSNPHLQQQLPIEPSKPCCSRDELATAVRSRT